MRKLNLNTEAHLIPKGPHVLFCNYN